MATDFKEVLYRPISVAELERRWSATRKAMDAEDIDCLVMQTANTYLGMYVRWFTDHFVEVGYPWTVIFDRKDGMTTIGHGTNENQFTPRERPADVGISRRLGEPYFVSCYYTGTMDAEAAVKDLKLRAAKKVGVVGKAVMSASFYEYLLANLPGVEIVDATDMVDRIQVVKSDEEIELVKMAAQIEDEAMLEILNSIKPGKTEYQIRSELFHIMADKGSEMQWVMIGSAPVGTPAIIKYSHFQNRVIRPGDQVYIIIEISGPGGYYCELGRPICLGSIPDEMVEYWELGKLAQKFTAEKLVPGAKPADIVKAHNVFMAAHGCAPETRAYSHGQGYNLVERPLIRWDEPMELQANMNIAVHPHPDKRTNAKVWVNAGDNFLVTEQGGVRLHKIPQQIFVV